MNIADQIRAANGTLSTVVPKMPTDLAMLFGLAKPHALPAHIKCRARDRDAEDYEPSSIELARTEKRRERLAAIVEYLRVTPSTHEELAKAMGCSLSTIKHDVAALRADGTVDAESSRGPVKWRAGRSGATQS